MTDPKDSAHPIIETDLYYDNAAGKHYPHVSSTGGLTKRERFAMAAMQGIATGYEVGEFAEEVAAASVAMADALIAELNKETP